MEIKSRLQKFIEERQALAIQKDLPKKIKLIVKTLGFAIRGNASIFSGGDILDYRAEPIDEDWATHLDTDDEEDGLPTQDFSQEIPIIGYYFDGLSSGINLQIHHNFQEEVVKLDFNGTCVYHEQSGQIDGYAPSDVWEQVINSFYKVAEKRYRRNNEKMQNDKKEQGQKRLSWVLDYLRKFWGA